MAIDTPARIAVIGAGPIGLEAALYGRYLGYDVDIYERGRLAEHVSQWGHARMFTPFGANASPLGIAALKAQDSAWREPSRDALLTGRETLEHYWRPLAKSDLLIDGLHELTEVAAVGRDWPLKGELVNEASRGDGMFRLLLESRRGDRPAERVAEADIVIDCGGTFGQSNWLGRGGVPAAGERSLGDRIDRGLPDILGADQAKFLGRTTLLVGGDLSAAYVMELLAELARRDETTRCIWVVRGPAEWEDDAQREMLLRQWPPLEVVPHDPLPQRKRLLDAATSLARADFCRYLPGFAVESFELRENRVQVALSGPESAVVVVDNIVSASGFRPDGSLHRELHIDSCPTTEAAKKPTLAAPDVEPGLFPECATLEPNYYLLGAKSRGRSGSFLIADGLAQIRQLYTLIGDRAGLDLYASVKHLA